MGQAGRQAVFPVHGYHDFLCIGPQSPDNHVGLGVAGVGDEEIHSFIVQVACLRVCIRAVSAAPYIQHHTRGIVSLRIPPTIYHHIYM